MEQNAKIVLTAKSIHGFLGNQKEAFELFFAQICLFRSALWNEVIDDASVFVEYLNKKLIALRALNCIVHANESLLKNLDGYRQQLTLMFEKLLTDPSFKSNLESLKNYYT